MRILITGADGELGKALQNLDYGTDQCFPLNEKQCDVTDVNSVKKNFCEIKPDAVIHCAAYTAVDAAETEKELCYSVNVGGTRNVSEACRQYGASIMLLSTDYVFDGTSDTPYETSSLRNALNYYGRCKIIAEDIISELENSLIVRTSWMFGDGQNFVRTMCRLSHSKAVIPVVNDQIGSPTFSEDLAPILIRLVKEQKHGVLHITNEGFCSWAELAQATMELIGSTTRIEPITAGQYNAQAVRPKNSRLSKQCLDGIGYPRLPLWSDALRRYISKYGERL